MTRTPGPWELTPDGVPDGWTQIGVYGGDGARVATVKTSDADARLIAAAPELANACADALDLLSLGGVEGGGPVVNVLRAALDAAGVDA